MLHFDKPYVYARKYKVLILQQSPSPSALERIKRHIKSDICILTHSVHMFQYGGISQKLFLDFLA